MKRLTSLCKSKALPNRAAGLLALLLLAAPAANADQMVVTGNSGTITASAKLNFNIAIAKYVMLRVGNADASVAAVTFAVGPNPAIAAGNSRSYTGAIPPAMATTVASTNPTTGAGTLAVAAYTNVAGTTLTCSLGPLAGAVPFATGATAGGIPGTSNITVTSTAGAGNLQAPGADLAACNGTTAPVANLTTLGGTFTYATTFAPASLAAGTYGNTVTYTATTL